MYLSGDDEIDCSWNDWKLPLNWRAQREDKEEARLGPSMGIRFPLHASMQRPEGITRKLISGFKQNKGKSIKLVELATPLYVYRVHLDIMKFLPRQLVTCLHRWYQAFTGLEVSLNMIYDVFNLFKHVFLSSDDWFAPFQLATHATGVRKDGETRRYIAACVWLQEVRMFGGLLVQHTAYPNAGVQRLRYIHYVVFKYGFIV
jgi:hypothetical protein